MSSTFGLSSLIGNLLSDCLLFMLQKISCGMLLSVLVVEPMAKWVQVQEHSILLLQLTVTCSSLEAVLVVRGPHSCIFLLLLVIAAKFFFYLIFAE